MQCVLCMLANMHMHILGCKSLKENSSSFNRDCLYSLKHVFTILSLILRLSVSIKKKENEIYQITDTFQ